MVFHLQSVKKATINALEEPEFPKAKTTPMSKSKFKAVTIVFFNIHGIVYINYNAPVHAALFVKRLLVNHQIPTLEQPDRKRVEISLTL